MKEGLSSHVFPFTPLTNSSLDQIVASWLFCEEAGRYLR